MRGDGFREGPAQPEMINDGIKVWQAKTPEQQAPWIVKARRLGIKRGPLSGGSVFLADYVNRRIVRDLRDRTGQ